MSDWSISTGDENVIGGKVIPDNDGVFRLDPFSGFARLAFLIKFGQDAEQSVLDGNDPFGVVLGYVLADGKFSVLEINVGKP